MQQIKVLIYTHASPMSMLFNPHSARDEVLRHCHIRAPAFMQMLGGRLRIKMRAHSVLSPLCMIPAHKVASSQPLQPATRT